MRNASGLTLVELIVSLAVAGLLAALALPSFGRLVGHNQRVAALNNFVTSLQFARSEAVKRGHDVVVCPSVDGRRCDHDAPEWQNGWLVFADVRAGVPRQVEGGDQLLRVQPAQPGVFIAANRDAFVMRPFTRRSSNGTVRFCSLRRGVAPRSAIVSVTGRPRNSATMPDGREIPCPAPD